MNNSFALNVAALMLASALSLATVQGALANDGDSRVSITTKGPASDLDAGTLTASSRDEFGALLVSGQRGTTSGAGQQKTSMNNASALNTDFWFYDAWVELYSDADRDGYYTGIELNFDADTVYAAADVFAVVYLSYEYGPWNEYAETGIFTILDTSALDEYTIETDLVSGYPPGDYDILIELYDAYDGSLVAAIGPEDSSELAILPLEDVSYDSARGDTTQIVLNSGGGGSVGWMLILALAGASGLLRQRVGAGLRQPPRHSNDLAAPGCQVVEIDVQCRND
ncbi:MAG: choice-of-anchor H family protein [Gammaproteobacteria bacterium]|nr:choice-of-anchor H family protein [Gammaproteobacteria bacterium]